MSPFERLLVASAAIGAGCLIGLVLRGRLRPNGRSAAGTSSLSAGLVVVTAPYCTRCTSIQRRLDEGSITFARLDAATEAARLATLGVSTVPTLVKIDDHGRVVDSESRDFSDRRLRELAARPADRR